VTVTTQDAVGNIRFYSITFRLFKLPGLLEPDCEDYGQVAVYKASGDQLFVSVHLDPDAYTAGLGCSAHRVLVLCWKLDKQSWWYKHQASACSTDHVHRGTINRCTDLGYSTRRHLSSAAGTDCVGAVLQGSIEGQPHAYKLDQGHVFETGRRTLVCGNTAAMLGENGLSWLAKHFEVRTYRRKGWRTPRLRVGELHAVSIQTQLCTRFLHIVQQCTAACTSLQ
jgi:hypothetical protein